MAYSRQEIAPSDQIKALRHARDRYAEMADRIHNDIDSTLGATERQTREDDARRIAKAYDRSLSNSLVQLSGMEKSHRTHAHSFGLWYRIAVLIALALSASLLISYFYAAPGALNRLRAYAQIGDAPSKENPLLATSRRLITSPVKTAQNPAPANADLPDKDVETKKSAVVLSVPGPKKTAPPHEKITKKAADSRPKKSLSKPADNRLVASNTPEVAKSAIASPAESPVPIPSAVIPALPQIEQRALPPIAMPIQPPAAPAPEPIPGTHTLPGYPPLSARTGEAGTTKISVAISPQGQAVDCRILLSSGSDRLDSVACAHVTEYWRWKPVTRDGLMTTPRTSVTIVWNLRKTNPSR